MTPTGKNREVKRMRKVEMQEMVEMIDELLREEKIEVENKAGLEKLAKAFYDALDEDSELDTFNIEELSDAIVALDDTTYEIVSVDDARLSEEVKDQIRDEVEYVAQSADPETEFYAKDKDELEEELEDILDYEISFFEANSSDNKAFETLERLFGSETLAKAGQEKADGTWMDIELRKIATLNDYYIVVDDPERFTAIRL